MRRRDEGILIVRAALATQVRTLLANTFATFDRAASRNVRQEVALGGHGLRRQLERTTSSADRRRRRRKEVIVVWRFHIRRMLEGIYFGLLAGFMRVCELSTQ